jgi:RND family efflux transporter MFP subunit
MLSAIMNKRLFCAALLGLTLTTLPAHSQTGGGAPKLVVLNQVEFVHQQNNIEAVGTAEAIKSVVLYPAAADEVIAINFVPGQKVNKGDILLRLDDRRQRVAAERARLQLLDAERSLLRLIESKKRGAVTQSEIDLATTTRDLAKVAVDEAKADLDDRTLVAPFSGILGLTDVEVGDRITTTTPITTLDDRSQLYVNFRAPESAVELLLHDTAVTLQPWANRGTQLEANIAQLDSRINATDRTLAARALLDNRQDEYRPGMSFRVLINLQGERFAAIPESALMWGATGAYIWKSVEGKAKRVDVNIQQRLRGTILVSGDLQEGDMLIAEGTQRLRSGQQVTTSLARSGQ